MVERDGYDGFNRRLRVLGILMVLVIAVLIGRAGYLQIYEGSTMRGWRTATASASSPRSRRAARFMTGTANCS